MPILNSSKTLMMAVILPLRARPAPLVGEVPRRFGQEFVALARSVYQQNDERGRIKRAINLLLGSSLIEEKQYSRY